MAGPRFIADPPHHLRRIELDGLTLLFHPRSGMTHVLAAPAPQILEAIAGRAGDAPEILARMARSFDVGADGDPLAALEARLDELEAAGLVLRVAPATDLGR